MCMKWKLKFTVGIICKNKRHKISLTQQGKLVFHDHSEGFKEDSALVSLGGEPCKCYKILLAWKKCVGKDRRKIPKGLFPQELKQALDFIYLKNIYKKVEKRFKGFRIQSVKQNPFC